MPTVSVIIPTYNHAHYLSHAIQSVLNQTYTDWETNIVDDGSTDNPSAVVEQFARPNIRYIYQNNQGLSAARNTGIRAAHGGYLAFLDADDEWSPEFLRYCVGSLDSDQTLAGVYTRNCFIDEHGDILPRVGGQIVPGAAFRSRVLEGGFFPPHAALIRDAVIDRVGVFDTQLTSLEDWDLWIRISARYPMQGISEPLARYRVYPGSMSTNAARMHLNRIRVLTKHFGPAEGSPATWSEAKRRAYGFAYRESAFGHILQRQPDEGWQLLAQAVSIWPPLFERLDTLYELVCGDQPRGYRVQPDMLNLERSGTDVLYRLAGLFDKAPPDVMPLQRAAYGNAYLAMGILGDQADNWTAARIYLMQSVKAHPRLLMARGVMRRLIKVCAGKRLVSWARFLLRRKRQGADYLAASHFTG